jgi:RNA polymerase sigma factor (sigma-70 family)
VVRIFEFETFIYLFSNKILAPSLSIKGVNMANEAKSKWFQGVLHGQQKRLLGYTFKVLRNQEKSKEVVQETYCKLWQQDYPEIVPSIPPWLYRVCRNHSIDILRKEKKLSSEEIDEGKFFLEGPTAEDFFDSTVALKQISELSPKKKEALVLKFSHDLTYKEIASIMNITTSNVGVLIHEGLKEVRISLGLTKKGGQND